MDLKLGYGDTFSYGGDLHQLDVDSGYVELTTSGGRFGGYNLEVYGFMAEDGTVKLAVSRTLDVPRAKAEELFARHFRFSLADGAMIEMPEDEEEEAIP